MISCTFIKESLGIVFFCVLHVTVRTHCCTSSLTSSMPGDDNLIQRFKVCIHHSIRPVVITFPCVIWHTAATFPGFPSSLPSFHYGQMRLWRTMDQLKHQVHLSDPVSGLYYIYFYFLRT